MLRLLQNNNKQAVLFKKAALFVKQFFHIYNNVDRIIILVLKANSSIFAKN